MGKRRKAANPEDNDTQVTMIVALFCAACAVLTIQVYAGDAIEAGWLHLDRAANWQVHMGTASVGLTTFVLSLSVLEFMETASKSIALRSGAPWVPLVGLTAIATIIHVPSILVAVVGVSYAVVAYRRTCNVRRSPASRKGKWIS